MICFLENAVFTISKEQAEALVSESLASPQGVTVSITDPISGRNVLNKFVLVSPGSALASGMQRKSVRLHTNDDPFFRYSMAIYFD